MTCFIIRAAKLPAFSTALLQVSDPSPAFQPGTASTSAVTMRISVCALKTTWNIVIYDASQHTGILYFSYLQRW